MFAVAQKKNTYIYDSAGVELHCLRKHQDVSGVTLSHHRYASPNPLLFSCEVNRLEFLPYHLLLVTVGKAGYIKYQVGQRERPAPPCEVS